MHTSQLKHESRRIFMRAFVRELIINSVLQIPHAKFKEVQAPLAIIKKSEKYEKSILVPRPLLETITPIIPKPQFKPKLEVKPSFPQLNQIASEMPADFNLGKLSFLLNDPRVTIIESPGPGKFILARTSGKNTMTQLSLTKEEIQAIVQKFSDESRIPIISGLFKAAVGNLILTAVISELVGSRFIITKVTPQFFLEQNQVKK